MLTLLQFCYLSGWMYEYCASEFQHESPGPIVQRFILSTSFEFIVCNIQLVLSRKLVSVFATIYLFAIIYRDDFRCSAKFFTSVRKELPSLVIRTHHSLVSQVGNGFFLGFQNLPGAFVAR